MSQLKEVMEILEGEWTWGKLTKRKYVDHLIWKKNGHGYRIDNRVVQNVGKPIVKFKFEVGSYIGGTPTTTPTHFSISTTGKGNRVSWMAMPNGAVKVRLREGKRWLEAFPITECIDDLSNPKESELDFLEMMYPDANPRAAINQLPELLPGLLGVDAALKERFT